MGFINTQVFFEGFLKLFLRVASRFFAQSQKTSLK